MPLGKNKPHKSKRISLFRISTAYYFDKHLINQKSDIMKHIRKSVPSFRAFTVYSRDTDIHANNNIFVIP